TMLLRLKAVHIDRKFGGHDHIGKVNKLPAFQLCTVAEIEIFGERVMLPASGIGNARLSPDACGSIKIEKPPAAAAGGLFEEKMTIQEEGLNLRQQRVIPVQVTPSHLHHPDPGVCEVIDGAFQRVGRRDEIGVENENELAFRAVQAGCEGPGFEALSIVSMTILDVEAVGFQAGGFARGNLAGFIRRVVQNLDLKPVSRIVEAADRPNEPANDVVLIEDRQLHGDERQVAEILRWLNSFTPVSQEEINNEIAMNSEG